MTAPRLPGLPTMSALMLAAILTACLGIWGPMPLHVFDIAQYQTLISAGVTAIGIAIAAHVAVRNVSKQLRINIVSREEERIEKTLPGLKEAVGFLRALRKTLGVSGSPHTWLNRLKQLIDLDPMKDRLDDKLRAMMPLTDIGTRQQIQLAIETFVDHAASAAADEDRYLKIVNSNEHRRELESNTIGQARMQAKTAQTGINFKVLAVQATIANLKQLEEHLMRRVDLYEARLLKFRPEIERYFEH